MDDENKKPETETEAEALPESSHYANFIDAVRTRNRGILNAEIRETHLSTALCHLGNIAYRLGRELHFNPAAVKFTNDSEADKLLRRSYRKPYVVPDQV